MGSRVPGGDALKYTPEFTLRMNGKNLGSFKDINFVGKVRKNKEPPVVLDYVDVTAWEEYLKRMSTEGRWTKIRTETGRIERKVEKNPLEGFTDWERRIKLIIDSHEK